MPPTSGTLEISVRRSLLRPLSRRKHAVQCALFRAPSRVPAVQGPQIANGPNVRGSRFAGGRTRRHWDLSSALLIQLVRPAITSMRETPRRTAFCLVVFPIWRRHEEIDRTGERRPDGGTLAPESIMIVWEDI